MPTMPKKNDKRLPRGGDHIKYLWLPGKKWSKGKVVKRKKNMIKFVGESDTEDTVPWDLDLDASKWEFIDKPDDEVNT